MHILKLRPKYFELIKNGEKIYEIRLNDEKRQGIDVGDVICFKKEPELVESFSAVVKDIIYFKTFAEMCDVLPFDKIGFDGDNKENVLKVFGSFYSKSDEQKYGVIVFKIKVIE